MKHVFRAYFLCCTYIRLDRYIIIHEVNVSKSWKVYFWFIKVFLLLSQDSRINWNILIGKNFFIRLFFSIMRDKFHFFVASFFFLGILLSVHLIFRYSLENTDKLLNRQIIKYLKFYFILQSYITATSYPPTPKPSCTIPLDYTRHP